MRHGQTELAVGQFRRPGLLRCCSAITRWRQDPGLPVAQRSAATVGNILRYNDNARPHAPLRAVIAVALTFWVVVVGAEWALLGADVTPAHGPHAVSTSPVIVEHPHIDNGPAPLAPDTFAMAVLPRVYTALVALGLVAALAAVVSLLRESTLPSIRGPPRALSEILSGRVLLTRLCIARC